MPIRPRKTRSCSTSSSNASRPAAVLRQGAEGDAERAQRLAGECLVGRQDLRSGALSVSGRASSPTSSCEQRVSRTSGAPLVKASRRSWRSASLCTVLISLRSEENGTSPRRAKRASSASASSPALRAATISAPSVGSPCTVQRPSRSCRTALLARSAAESVRTNSDRSAPIDRPAAVPAAASPFRRVAGAAEGHASACGRDHAHGHLVLRERAGLVGGDHVGGAERLDGREMAHDGVTSSPCAARRARAPPSRSPAGPRGPRRPRARRRG